MKKLLCALSVVLGAVFSSFPAFSADVFITAEQDSINVGGEAVLFPFSGINVSVGGKYNTEGRHEIFTAACFSNLLCPQIQIGKKQVSEFGEEERLFGAGLGLRLRSNNGGQYSLGLLYDKPTSEDSGIESITSLNVKAAAPIANRLALYTDFLWSSVSLNEGNGDIYRAVAAGFKYSF